MQASREQIVAAGSDTAVELKRLSANAVTAMSRRDWSMNKTPEAREVLEHIDPDWTGDFDNYPEPLTLPEQIAAHRKLFSENPLGYYEVQRITVDVDEAADIAVVLLEIDAKGVENVTFGGLCEFRWRRVSGGKWMWFYHKAMRGMPLGNSEW